MLHNGPLSRRQRWRIALVHGGPRALLTAFTAAEAFGLRGWERDTVHVLAPSGTRQRRGCPLPMRLHTDSNWDHVRRHRESVLQVLPDALLRPVVSPPPAAGAATSGDTGGLLGRRRYLDAVWRDGRIVVVEVDGALHLAPSRGGTTSLAKTN